MHKMASLLSVEFLSAGLLAQAPFSAAEPVTDSQATSPATAFTPPRIDPKHRLTIREQYYPLQSKIAGEEGKCYVALLVDIDGRITAVQLLTSTGYLRLDAACIAAVVNERMLPATVNGKPAVGWFAAPMTWLLAEKKLPRQSLVGLAIPRMPNYYELQVGNKFYPATALERKEQGICVVHLLVNAKGSVSETRLSKSTGFADLDRACVDAVILAEFIPAQATGAPPTDAWTDVAMIWRLPK